MISWGRTTSALALSLVMLSSGLFGLFGAQAQNVTVKIGDIATTVADRADSQAISQLALADVNKYMADFNHPYRFEAVLTDAGGTDSGHTAALTSLKAQGVSFVLGGDTDSMASASLSYANNNGILLLSSASRSASLAVVNDNLFRLAASDQNIGPSIASMLWSKGVRYACVLQRIDGWADGIYADFDSEWRALGGQYVGAVIKYPTTTTLFGTYLDNVESQIAAAAPLYTVNQIGLVVISLNEILTIIDQVGARPYIASVNWYSTDRMAKNPTVLAAQKYFATSVHLYSPLESYEPTLMRPSIDTRFSLITGHALGDEDARRYDWYWIVALTVLKNGSTDTALAKITMLEVAGKYMGATGRCVLNSAGDRGEPLYDIWGYALVNNVYTSVEAGWIEYPPLAHWNSLEKPSIAVSCVAAPEEILGNQPILLQGSTSPQKPSGSVRLELWDSDDTPTDMMLATNKRGQFNTTLRDLASGIWHFQVTWAGDASSRASTSPIGAFTVARTPTSVAIDVVPVSILMGEGVSVNGTFSPGFTGTPIKLDYKAPGGAVTTRAVTGDAKGKFTDSFTPGVAGNWTVVARFDGDLTYLASTSAAVKVSVAKRSTSINVLVSAASVVEGGNVSAYGQLNPPLSGKQVTVTATAPGGTGFDTQATTDAQGRYSATFHPAEIGTWSFSARYQGDGTYKASVSGSAQLTVSRLPPKATIKIVVKDDQAKALPGATVTSTAQPPSQATLSGTTGADGSVAFSGVIPGDYSFLAALSGYNSATVSLNAPGGVTTERTIVLTKTQQPSQGIPGFPIEAVVLGALVSLYALFRLYRRRPLDVTVASP